MLYFPKIFLKAYLLSPLNIIISKFSVVNKLYQSFENLFSSRNSKTRQRLLRKYHSQLLRGSTRVKPFPQWTRCVKLLYVFYTLFHLLCIGCTVSERSICEVLWQAMSCLNKYSGNECIQTLAKLLAPFMETGNNSCNQLYFKLHVILAQYIFSVVFCKTLVSKIIGTPTINIQ